MQDDDDGGGRVDGLERDLLLAGVSPYVFTLEDALQIDSLCSVANAQYTIAGVMLTGDYRLRPFQFVHNPNSNRTLASSRFNIGTGWLLRLRVAATSGTPLDGQAFVWARICRGLTSVAAVNGTIASGYITANTDVFWPGGEMLNPLDGEGVPLSITIANPAAGVDFSQTVPTGARWKLNAVAALLTTSATVATRAPRLVIDDGATTLIEIPAAATQAASLAVGYTYGAGAGGPIISDTAVIEAPIPNDLWLQAGWRVRSAVGAIQAADQWSLVRLLVNEWLEGS